MSKLEELEEDPKPVGAEEKQRPKLCVWAQGMVFVFSNEKSTPIIERDLLRIVIPGDDNHAPETIGAFLGMWAYKWR